MKEEEKDLIGYDFQGWPLYKRSIRDFLISFGLTLDEDGVWKISDKDPRLDIRPSILHDDGMGYGVDEQFPIEIDTVRDICHIFVESKEE